MKEGPTFLGFLVLLLTGLFVAGKIFGFIEWSWWLVLLPVLIYVGLPLGIVAAVVAAILVAMVIFLVGALAFILISAIWTTIFPAK